MKITDILKKEMEKAFNKIQEKTKFGGNLKNPRKHKHKQRE